MNINKVVKYDPAQPLEQDIVYYSDVTIRLISGRYAFRVFGTVRIDEGFVLTNDVLRADMANDFSLDLVDGATVLFMSLPKRPAKIPKVVEVDKVPDNMESGEAQLNEFIRRYLIANNIMNQSIEPVDVSLDDDIEDGDIDDIPLDTDSLVDEPLLDEEPLSSELESVESVTSESTEPLEEPVQEPAPDVAEEPPQ